MNQAAATAIPDTIRMKIAGMDCGSCALTIENSLRQLPGMKSVAVSFTTESMEVAGDVPRAAIEQRLRELGYRLAAAGPVTPVAPGEHRGPGGFVRFLWEQPHLRLAGVVGVVVAVAAAVLAGQLSASAALALNVVFALAVIVVGAPVFIKGFRALIFARRITIDLLMAIATVGALAIGEGGEAATVILLFTLGEALEAYSAERARDSLKSLMSLQPQQATVLREHRGAHAPAKAEQHGHDHHDHGHDSGHGHDHAGPGARPP